MAVQKAVNARIARPFTMVINVVKTIVCYVSLEIQEQQRTRTHS